MNPENTKAFIVTPEKYVMSILQINHGNRICKINQTINEIGQKKPTSINLSHTFSLWMKQQNSHNSSKLTDSAESMTDDDPISHDTTARWHNNKMTISMIARLGAKVKTETKTLQTKRTQNDHSPSVKPPNSSETTPALVQSMPRPDTSNHRPRKMAKRETPANPSIQQLTSQLNELKVRFQQSQQIIQQLQQQLLNHTQPINQPVDIEHQSAVSPSSEQRLSSSSFTNQSNINELISIAVKDSLDTMLKPLVDAAKDLANQQSLTDLKLRNIASILPILDSRSRKRSRSLGSFNRPIHSPVHEPTSKHKKTIDQQSQSTSTKVTAVSTSNGTAVSQC